MTAHARYVKAYDPEDFVNRVMARWDQQMDTLDIARELQANEALVDRALRIGRERRLHAQHS